MSETFKEIEKYLDTTNESLTLYQDKINRLEAAINIMEEENISIPEAVFGSLYYYKSEFEKLSKGYRDILGLRNKMKRECKHNYEITQMGDGKYYNIGTCKICGHIEYIKI